MIETKTGEHNRSVLFIVRVSPSSSHFVVRKPESRATVTKEEASRVTERIPEYQVPDSCRIGLLCNVPDLSTIMDDCVIKCELANSESEADEEAAGAGAEHGLGGGGRGGVDQGGEEEAEQETLLGGARHDLGHHTTDACN